MQRTYDSPLREEQARRTRERILDALIRIMAKGVAEISMPAVAREAGVSVPTVYRHFGSKRELVAALSAYVVPKTRLAEHPPKDLSELRDDARTLFRRYDRLDGTIRAAMASQLGNEIRRDQMPSRRAMFRDAVRGSEPTMADQDAERLTNMLVLLFSSVVMRAFKDYLDLPADEAADHVAWTIERLVASAKGTEGPPTLG